MQPHFPVSLKQQRLLKAQLSQEYIHLCLSPFKIGGAEAGTSQLIDPGFISWLVIGIPYWLPIPPSGKEVMNN